MDDKNVDFRSWDQFVPDLLGLAFCKLSLEEKLLVVPVVCKAWWRVVMGSSTCWKEIVIDTRRNKRVLVRLLRMLILRSGRSLQKLSVPELPNKMFSLVAEYGGRLETLELHRGKMTDSTIEKLCGKFCLLRSLDLSYCTRIGAPALLAIGRHCKSLESFYRNAEFYVYGEKGSHDDEAYAIAGAMPKLKHLEVSGRLMTTRGFLEILNCCAELKSINIRCCWDVEPDEKFLIERFPELKVESTSLEEFLEILNCCAEMKSISDRFDFDPNLFVSLDPDEQLEYY